MNRQNGKPDDDTVKHSNFTAGATGTEFRIPVCQTNFNLDDARGFIDEMLKLLSRLEDLSDLDTLYQAAKELNDTFANCAEHRIAIARLLVEHCFPSMLTRFLKRLNKMGVFSNEDTWFSTFYFYSIAWNYTDVSVEFATAIASTGIARLLTVNLAHQPYLDNKNCRNVYFLIKASLSILHNMCKVPGNRDLCVYPKGREALWNMMTIKGDESLKCLATLCLAYTFCESELGAEPSHTAEVLSISQCLLRHIHLASASTRHRYRGLTMCDYLTALAMFITNEGAKQCILTMQVAESQHPLADKATQGTKKTLVRFLTQCLFDAFNSSSWVNKETEYESAISLRIIFQLLHTPSMKMDPEMRECLKLIRKLVNHPMVTENGDSALHCICEQILWQHEQPKQCLIFRNHPLPPTAGDCGPIVISYAIENQLAVVYLMEKIRAIGLPILANPVEFGKTDPVSAGLAGLTGLAASVGSTQAWLDCLHKATVMIVCLSDAYRLSPGCRSEIEHFITLNLETNPKRLIYLRVPPKSTVRGWVAGLPGVHNCLDLTNKQTFLDVTMQLLFEIGKLYATMLTDDHQKETIQAEDGHAKHTMHTGEVQKLKSPSILSTSSLSSGSSDRNTGTVLFETNELLISTGSLRCTHSTDSEQTRSSGSNTMILAPSVQAELMGSTAVADSEQHMNPTLTVHPRTDTGVNRIPVGMSRLEAKYHPTPGVSEQSLSGDSAIDWCSPFSCMRALQLEQVPDKGNDPTQVRVGVPVSVGLDYAQLALNEVVTDTGCQSEFSSQQINAGNQHFDCIPDTVQKAKENQKGGFNLVKSNVRNVIGEPILASSYPVAQCIGRCSLLAEVKQNQSDLGLRHEIPRDNSPTKAAVSGEIGVETDVIKCESTTEIRSPHVVMTTNETNVVEQPHKEETFEHKPLLNAECEKNSALKPAQQEINALNPETVRSKLEKPTAAVTAANDSVKVPGESISELVTKLIDLLIQSTSQAAAEIDRRLSGPNGHIGATQQQNSPKQRFVRVSRYVDNCMQTVPEPQTEHGRVRVSQTNGALRRGIQASTGIKSPVTELATRCDEVIEPQIRTWTSDQVTRWFESKGLHQSLHGLSEALDGTVLAQLAYLKHWAPEYFAQSLRKELGLGFIQSLRFVDALEELTLKNRHL